MVISKSTKKKEKWIARAFCFSGRPDPTWVVRKSVIKQLEKIWDSLEPQSVKFPISPPNLGYLALCSQIMLIANILFTMNMSH
jgi:hypothetical protein